MKKVKIIGICLCLSAVLTASGAVGSAADAQGKYVVPLGFAVGIDVRCDGVLVVGLAPAEEGQPPTAAQAAGIEKGDLITQLAGKSISCSQDFMSAVSELGGEAVSVRLQRGSEELELLLTPQMTPQGAQLGMWLRDGISGVGTLTFYDKEQGMFAGLGHGINDAESGVLFPLGSGKIYRAGVSEVRKGCAGTPGELCGIFDLSGECGEVLKNTPVGVYGVAGAEIAYGCEAIPVAEDGEISLGGATVLANVSGSEVESFDVEIERIYHGDAAGRSLMLSVRDERLLEITGGIVQGMSGSPIIQNGKLVGAITHVMINDPQKGFGISARLMLEQCGGHNQSQKAA